MTISLPDPSPASRRLRSLWTHPLAWVLHAAFFVACIGYAVARFEGSFPIVHLRVTLDRAAALKSAEKLFAERGYPPRVPSGSAPGAAFVPRFTLSFDTDSAVQNYVELEAGGAGAFARLIEEGHYSPYSWRVRGYAEGQTSETQLRFLPDGKLGGFSIRLPEDEPGAQLDEAAARKIAEAMSRLDFGVEIADYLMVEHSQERTRGGRVDHSFTYEHSRVRYGGAPLRLRLEVSGDRLTEVTRFLKIPDAFARRYAELRSANTTLASLAMALIALFYGLAGCVGGLVWLARQRAFSNREGRGVFRAALALSVGIAVLHLADELNGLPQSWMAYDTAIAASDFRLRQLVDAVFGTVMHFLSLFFPILAALGLSRAAFPEQPTLAWAVSPLGRGSRAVFGRVLGAYLTVGFHFAFVVWIYRMGSTHWGWWNPSDLLFHPDALAAPLPWFNGIASSLHAGIWEECLFRAVPLAGFALLFKKYLKGRWRWLGFAAAMILQALIFGAGHASYPTQPAYARVIELIVPSFVFGSAYLLAGLIPGMIMHYLYDVVLFSMPVFTTAGGAARFSQAIVIGVSLVPLIVVLTERLRRGRWTTAQDERGLLDENEGGAMRGSRTSSLQGARPQGLGLSLQVRQWVLGLALLGCVTWLALGRINPDVPFPTIARGEAIQRAQRVLQTEGITLGSEWRALTALEGAPDEDDAFVWKQGGSAFYREWIEKFLAPPLWRVRWVRPDGKVEDRAEEYSVLLTGDGRPYRFRHELPEGRPGKLLEEKEARSLAEGVLMKRFGRRATDLELVSSTPAALPARRDWYWVWKDPAAKVGSAPMEGEGRYSVKLAGDEVSYYRQYVEVPERWQRTERQRRAFLGVLRTVGGAFSGLLGLWVLWTATLGALHGGGFAMPIFRRVLGFSLLGTLILSLNRVPERMASFATSQPWSSQLFRLGMGEALWALVAALGLAVFWAWASAGDLSDRDGVGKWLAWPVLGLGSVTSVWSHPVAPFWEVPGSLAKWVPELGALSSVFQAAAVTGFFILFSQHSRSRLFTFVFGLSIGVWMSPETIVGVAVSSGIWGLGLLTLAEAARCTGAGMWIGLVTWILAIGQVQEMRLLGATPGGRTAGLGLILILIWAWRVRVDSRLR